jgi:hypothetical protein
MQLDVRVTLDSDIGKGRRANLKIERRKMARCQYQNGCLFVCLFVCSWQASESVGCTLEGRRDSR